MINLQKIEIREVLTPLKSKVINTFRNRQIIKLKDLLNLTGLKYRQIEWITERLINVGILERIKPGKYRLTELGTKYIETIDLFNLPFKENFKLIGSIDVNLFLNGLEGATILGGLLSDGDVSKNRIKFLTTDESLNRYVWDRLIKIFNKKVKEKYGYIQGRLNVEFLKLFTPTYRKKPFRENGRIISWPNVKIPDFIMKGSKEQKIEFLKTYASCDGGVSIELWWDKQYMSYNIRAWVFIACKNPILQEQLSRLLEDVGLRVNFRSKNELLLSGENVNRFKEIGFVEGCKVVQGKYWKGIEKNDLLNLAIIIQKIGSDIIPPFLRVNKSKDDEIREFLKFLILEIKKNGLDETVKKFFELKIKNKLLRKIPINWIKILQLLENRELSFNDIINEMVRKNYKDSFEEARKGISCILSRMKKYKLINNETLNQWKITNEGKELLIEYRNLTFKST
jgi:predicted transcriptional regulator